MAAACCSAPAATHICATHKKLSRLPGPCPRTPKRTTTHTYTRTHAGASEGTTRVHAHTHVRTCTHPRTCVYALTQAHKASASVPLAQTDWSWFQAPKLPEAQPGHKWIRSCGVCQSCRRQTRALRQRPLKTCLASAQAHGSNLPLCGVTTLARALRPNHVPSDLVRTQRRWQMVLPLGTAYFLHGHHFAGGCWRDGRLGG